MQSSYSKWLQSLRMLGQLVFAFLIDFNVYVLIASIELALIGTNVAVWCSRIFRLTL